MTHPDPSLFSLDAVSLLLWNWTLLMMYPKCPCYDVILQHTFLCLKASFQSKRPTRYYPQIWRLSMAWWLVLLSMWNTRQWPSLYMQCPWISKEGALSKVNLASNCQGAKPSKSSLPLALSWWKSCRYRLFYVSSLFLLDTSSIYEMTAMQAIVSRGSTFNRRGSSESGCLLSWWPSNPCSIQKSLKRFYWERQLLLDLLHNHVGSRKAFLKHAISWPTGFLTLYKGGVFWKLFSPASQHALFFLPAACIAPIPRCGTRAWC